MNNKTYQRTSFSTLCILKSRMKLQNIIQLPFFCYSNKNVDPSIGLIIHYFSCGRGKTPSERVCPGNDTKLHLMARIRFWRSEECGVSLHCYYSQCNVMAKGFRFMPLSLVRLRTFRLSTCVRCKP